MSSLSQFVGGEGITPRGLINGTSPTAPVILVTNALSTVYGPNGCRITTSGALSANTLSTVLSLSGKGALSFLACGSVDATSRTHRLKITLDGVVVHDGTTSAVSTVASWYIPIGSVNLTSATLGLGTTYEPICFNTSLLVEYASSLGETAKTTFAYRYIPR